MNCSPMPPPAVRRRRRRGGSRPQAFTSRYFPMLRQSGLGVPAGGAPTAAGCPGGGHRLLGLSPPQAALVRVPAVSWCGSRRPRRRRSQQRSFLITAEGEPPGVISVMKRLPTFRLPITLPTLIPILSGLAAARRPPLHDLGRVVLRGQVRDAEVAADPGDGGLERLGVAGVAREHLHGDRAAFGVGEQPVLDLPAAALAILGIAERGQPVRQPGCRWVSSRPVPGAAAWRRARVWARRSPRALRQEHAGTG